MIVVMSPRSSSEHVAHVVEILDGMGLSGYVIDGADRKIVEVLAANGVPTDGLSSKNWDVFAEPGAPEMDLVITVCDNAAGEVCPVWPGHPAQVHWGFPDPAACTGDDDEKRTAFAAVYTAIKAQIQRLVDTPLDGLDVAGRIELLRSMAPEPDPDT